MFDQNQNPMPINRIERNRARSGHDIVNLYGGILELPLLVIPEQHFELLLQAGINPNELEFGRFHHVQLLAYWQDSTVHSPSGKPYRDVKKLVSNNPAEAAERARWEQIVELLQQMVLRLDILCQTQMISGQQKEVEKLLN